MYQVIFEGSDLVESYTILKFSKTILRGICNKNLGEGKYIVKNLNTTIKKKPSAYQIVHIFFGNISALLRVEVR